MMMVKEGIEIGVSLAFARRINKVSRTSIEFD